MKFATALALGVVSAQTITTADDVELECVKGVGCYHPFVGSCYDATNETDVSASEDADECVEEAVALEDASVACNEADDCIAISLMDITSPFEFAYSCYLTAAENPDVGTINGYMDDSVEFEGDYLCYVGDSAKALAMTAAAGAMVAASLF